MANSRCSVAEHQRQCADDDGGDADPEQEYAGHDNFEAEQDKAERHPVPRAKLHHDTFDHAIFLQFR